MAVTTDVHIHNKKCISHHYREISQHSIVTGLASWYGAAPYRVAPKGRMFLIGFRRCSDKFEFYTRNHSHKQSSILDTIFNYIFYFGAPGKYLYLSPENPLSVGRRSRPRDNRCSRLFYRYFPGAPK